MLSHDCRLSDDRSEITAASASSTFQKRSSMILLLLFPLYTVHEASLTKQTRACSAASLPITSYTHHLPTPAKKRVCLFPFFFESPVTWKAPPRGYVAEALRNSNVHIHDIFTECLMIFSVEIASTHIRGGGVCKCSLCRGA